MNASSILFFAWFVITLLASSLASGATPNLRKVNTNGTELAYVQAGTGTPVVFVHGELADQSFWDSQRDVIASQYSFVSYSLRYHHPNAWPDGGAQYTYATHIADLAALIRTISSSPVHLVGHGMGANIALRLALAHPELLKTLTLAEPSPLDLATESKEGRAGLAEFKKRLAPVSNALAAGRPEQARQLFSAALSGGRAAVPPALDSMARDNERTLALLIAMAPPEPKVDCGSLGSLRVPTQMLTGTWTFDLARATSDRLADCIAGSEHVLVPGGHLMNLREPRAFNQALLVFLRQHEKPLYRSAIGVTDTQLTGLAN